MVRSRSSSLKRSSTTGSSPCFACAHASDARCERRSRTRSSPNGVAASRRPRRRSQSRGASRSRSSGRPSAGGRGRVARAPGREPVSGRPAAACREDLPTAGARSSSTPTAKVCAACRCRRPRRSAPRAATVASSAAPARQRPGDPLPSSPSPRSPHPAAAAAAARGKSARIRDLARAGVQHLLLRFGVAAAPRESGVGSASLQLLALDHRGCRTARRSRCSPGGWRGERFGSRPAKWPRGGAPDSCRAGGDHAGHARTGSRSEVGALVG